LSQAVGAYLDFALKSEGGVRRHNFVRKLFSLSRRMTSELFVQSIERALRYRITSVETIERIALLSMTQDAQILPDADVDEDFQQREAYLEGRLTDAPDFSIYEKMLEDEDDG